MKKQEPQQEQKQAQWVSAFIPEALRQTIEKMAKDEDRSLSQVVRRLLEESPRMKAALRQTQKKAA